MQLTYKLKVEYLSGPLVIPGIGPVKRAIEGAQPTFRSAHAAENEAKRIVRRSPAIVTVVDNRGNVIGTYGRADLVFRASA